MGAIIGTNSRSLAPVSLALASAVLFCTSCAGVSSTVPSRTPEEQGATGTAPTGAAPTGPELTGTTPRGTTPSGTEPKGPAPTGTTPTGTAQSAAADDLSITGGVIGGTYSLTDIRIGRHEGFTRVVWEMSEAEGAPRHEVVQRVVGGADVGGAGAGAAGSNDPLSVASTGAIGQSAARLEIILSDVYAYGMTGALSVDAPEEGTVLGVRLLPLESDSQLRFAIDLAQPASAIDVRTLEDPVRVMVDVPDG